MMKVLLFLLSAFSLYSTGLGLACVQCMDDLIPFCSGNRKNCTKGELCMSTITQTTAAEGQKTFTFERDCGDANYCNTSGSMTSLLSTETRSTCCNFDGCTPPLPSLSKEVKLENKVQCPACLVHNNRTCSSWFLRNCTGDEKYCAVYEIKRDTDSTIIKGCASESFCHSSQSKKLVDGKIIQMMARCVRSGSDGLEARVFLLPVLLAMLVHIA